MSYYDAYEGNGSSFKPKKKKWNPKAAKPKEKGPFYKREIIYDEQKLKNYAINKLSKQDWGRKELFLKMSRYQKDADIVNKVLDLLENAGYLSDKRRINSVLKQFSTREAVNKTKQRLTQKGFTKDQIKEVVEEREEQSQYEEVDENLPFTILERKFRNIRPFVGEYTFEEKQKVKEKMTRFLAGRGFSFDDIRKAMNEFFNGDLEE